MTQIHCIPAFYTSHLYVSVVTSKLKMLSVFLFKKGPFADDVFHAHIYSLAFLTVLFTFWFLKCNMTRWKTFWFKLISKLRNGNFISVKNKGISKYYKNLGISLLLLRLTPHFSENSTKTSISTKIMTTVKCKKVN